MEIGKLIRLLQGFDRNLVVVVDNQGETRELRKNDFREQESFYDVEEGDDVEKPCVIITTWE